MTWKYLQLGGSRAQLALKTPSTDKPHAIFTTGRDVNDAATALMRPADEDVLQMWWVYGLAQRRDRSMLCFADWVCDVNYWEGLAHGDNRRNFWSKG